jgi:protein-L-isoaspartate(D-aspartate) O-methyltransferase
MRGLTLAGRDSKGCLLGVRMDFASLRHQMVQHQLRGRGISDERLLAVMADAPRHLFVPERQRKHAYDDGPLPIGTGQTISQPYMVAKMTELLDLAGTETVLEIGTGSGYQAAVLGRLAAEVWTIERHEELARRAEAVLAELGLKNVRVLVGDGTLGFPEAAPFDAIIVTAAAPRVPEALRDQLGVGGRMVIPVSVGYNQDLRLIEKLPAADGDVAPTVAAEGAARDPSPDVASALASPCRFRETSILSCVFVPLVGEQGYSG